MTMFYLLEQITSMVGKILKPIVRNPPPIPVAQAPFVKPLPTLEPTPVLTLEPMLEFTPKKDFHKPSLWKYYPDKSKDIWYAINHKNYIQPDNELVAYFTERIEFNSTMYLGRLMILHKGTDKSVNFIYYIDDARLCRIAGQDYQECNELNDFWMNPDYYVWNELNGDCEDYSLLIGSVCERLKLPYMVVAGYAQFLGGIRDWWVEFVYEKNVYIAQVNKAWGMPNLLTNVKGEFKPLLMFNKRTSMTEYKKWYKEI